MYCLRRHAVTVVFTCLACVSGFALGETPRTVSVPGGDLIDALESLATQYGVDVVYPSAQLKGHTTRGLSGTLGPTDAFRALLEGTPLIVKQEAGAWLITAASTQAPPSAREGAAGPIDEVAVEARRGPLEAMREEIGRLEARFYVEYNQLNSDPQFEVNCRMERLIDSHLTVRFCQPAFATQATEGEARMFSGVHTALPAEMVIRQKTPAYQKHMKDLVRQNPKLLALLKERAALVRRYERASHRKFDQEFVPF